MAKMRDTKNALIELTPFAALSILSFLREYVNDENKDVEVFSSLHKCVNEYENDVILKLSKRQLDDALAEVAMHRLNGSCPNNGENPM